MWLVASVAVAILGFVLVRYRQSYLRERPFELERVDYESATKLARELAQRLHLEATQRPPGLDWVGDFFLAPVWLFWGDLRSRRATTRLSRWSLHGTRNDRTTTVQLGPDVIELGVAMAHSVLLWARASLPLEQQEGLRAIHPVGSEAWQHGAEKIAALFALGVEELRVSNDVLIARAPLKAFTPERAESVLDALAATASAV